MVTIGLEEESADTQILHEAAAEAKRGKAGEGGDISKLFGDSEAEGEPKASTRASKRARTTVVETCNSEPEERSESKRAIPTRKSKRAKTSKSSKTSTIAIPMAGRKKQKASSKYRFAFIFHLYLPFESQTLCSYRALGI